MYLAEEADAMKQSNWRILALSIAAYLASAQVCSAVDLYFNDIEAATPGTGVRPDGFYEFHGDGGNVVLTEEVTAADGVGGSKSYRQTINSTGAPYFYSGFGQYAVDFSNMPTGPDANNPAMYRFSADVKANGYNNSMPLAIRVAAIDPDYETEHNIDVNGDSVISGGASVYEPVITPLIAGPGLYTHASFTLDQGTQEVDPDVRPQDRVFSNSLSLLWQVSYNNGGFGLDAGNLVSIDNVRIEFLGQIVGLAGDYNGNDVVDAADYTVWRDSLGGAILMNEAMSFGVVDQEDYDYWSMHFGETAPGSGGASAVPEPVSAWLTLGGLLGIGASIARRRSGVFSAIRPVTIQ
jgi:hypothetical protein